MKFTTFLTFHSLDPEDNGDTVFSDHLEQAILADKLGYDGISLPEHPLVHLIKAPTALVNAVAIGQHVKCEIGIAVVIMPLHHPLTLAGELAQADQALNGRLALGVGRGAYRYEFDRYGVDFNESRSMMFESLQILEAIWSHPDGSVAHHGKHWSFDDVYVWPRPVRRHGPPIWVAGQTAATIEWAVDHNYNVLNALMRRPDAIVEQVTVTFHRRREERGLSRDDVKLGISRPTFVSTDPAALQRRVDEAQELHKIHTHMHNFTDSANAKGYVAPRDVPDLPSPQEMRTGMLMGFPGEVLERVERYYELGVDELHLGMGFGAPHAEVMDSLHNFAENVMVPFRRNHGIAGPVDPLPTAEERKTDGPIVLHFPAGDVPESNDASGTTTTFVTSKAWIKIAMHHSGSGPAIVIIPDIGQTADDVANMAIVLADENTVYVIERRGRGASEDEQDVAYGVTRESETDIVQALNTIPEPVVVLGLGYGAALATRAAALTQTPMRALVLWEGGLDTDPALRPELLRVADEVDAALAGGDVDGAVATFTAFAGGNSTPDGARAAINTVSRELRELAEFEILKDHVRKSGVPIVALKNDVPPEPVDDLPNLVRTEAFEHAAIFTSEGRARLRQLIDQVASPVVSVP